ncbi:MAG: hypothetical protein NVS1B4_17190 [Gemmatimonadaceae bacterium]
MTKSYHAAERSVHVSKRMASGDVVTAWMSAAAAWCRTRTPLMSRAHHEAQVRALSLVAADLCTAVQQAGEASALAMRQWQDVARQAIAEREQARRERDAAGSEVDRLRSTVASLVLAGVKSVRDGG